MMTPGILEWFRLACLECENILNVVIFVCVAAGWGVSGVLLEILFLMSFMPTMVPYSNVYR